jgi:hypothetical protein
VLDEAITDHGTKWVTGEIAWTKYGACTLRLPGLLKEALAL